MVALERVCVALLVVSYSCCIASAEMNFTVDNGFNVPAGVKGFNELYTNRSLSGIWTGICANRWTLGPIDYQLWLVTSDFYSFTLCMIAVNANAQVKNLKAKVIWSANPGNPVTQTASLKRPNQTGNLLLIDSDRIVWSTKTGNSSGVLTLRVTDMGNMLLLDNQSAVIWQSFDDLTDTLPFRRVLKPGNKMTSSISTSNRTQGPYSLQVERNRLVLYSRFGEDFQQQETYWVRNAASSNMEIFAALCAKGNEDGTFRNSIVLGTMGGMPQSFEGELDCDAIQQPVEEMHVGNSDTYPTFLSLQPDGNLEVHVWNNKSTSWDTIFSLLETCNLPRKCGPFRTCTSGVCGVCPAGFVDVDPKQEELGCRPSVSRRSSESCSTDTFQEVKGYHYFAADFNEPTNITAEKCLRQCSQDCSCQASFYRKENSSSYCYVSHNVGTIQEMNGDPKYRAFLRLHGAPEKKSKSHVPEIVGGTIGASAALIFMVLIIRRMKRKTVNVSEVYGSSSSAFHSSSFESLQPR